ncbi:MAG: Rrf2 family transcriptional regulator [Bacteriovorax sp.]|nr:Rrf2 family transcriptional regulator [Bacteriovorax sp.]
MLKINKKVEYALMALKFMADKTPTLSINGQSNEQITLTSAREICDEFNTPFDTTAKVMQLMNNHEILKSVKGIKGGYSLNKDLSKITYMNLVRLIEGKEVGRVCITNKGTCELFGKCNIVSPIELLNRKLNLFLETLSLADLLQGADFNPRHIHAQLIINTQEKTL